MHKAVKKATAKKTKSIFLYINSQYYKLTDEMIRFWYVEIDLKSKISM